MHAVASSTQFSIMFPSCSILCGRRRNYQEYLTHCLSYLRHAIEIYMPTVLLPSCMRTMITALHCGEGMVGIYGW